MRKLKLFLSLLMLMCFSVGNVMAEETEYYSYTFGSQQFSDNTTAQKLGDITWTPATSWSVGSGYWGYDGTKGQQWGSGSHTLNTMTLTSGTSVSNVTKVTVNASIASSGGCKLKVQIGDTQLGSEQTLTTSATNYDFTSATGLSGVVKIILTNGSKKKAQYIKSIKIYTTGSSAELVSIAVTGDLDNKSYEVGDDIDFTGLTATGTYDDESEEDLTSIVDWSFTPALSSTSVTSVTVTATKGSISGNKLISGLTVTEHVVTPGTYDITMGNALWGTSYTGTASSETEIEGTSHDVTITLTKGGSTNMYITDSETRAYTSYSLVISVPEGYNITAMVFTKGSNFNMSTTVGTLKDKVNWSGEANSVPFTFGGRSDFQAVKVTYQAATPAAPSVTLTPKVIDFGDVYRGESVETQEIAIAGSNLTEDALTFTRKAGEESKFSVALKEGNSLTPASQLVNAALLVTPNTSEAGEFSDSIRINGGGLGQDTARAFVKINVKERVWTEDGADHDFGTILQYGDKPEPYKFTLKGTHLTPGSEIIIYNSLGTNYYVFSPDYVKVDANGEINEEITVSLESTQYPSTMTNTVHVRSNGDADPGVERNLFTVTTAVTIRHEVVATTDEHGNTFEWVSGTTELEKENNPQYVIPTTFVKATATPAAGYQFDSWNIYNTDDSETKVEHVDGEFNMPSYDVTISGSFSKSVTPDIVVSETELDFGSVDVNSTPVPQTFTITGASLTENVAINWRAEAGYDQDFVTWEVTEGSLTPEGGAVAATVTVTPKTNAVEDFLGELIISSAGATDKHLSLYLVVNKRAAGLVWSAEEATVTIDADDNIFPTLTNPNSLAVTYSSNADGVATISNEEGHEGEIELIGAGDVTITATFAGNGTYTSQVVSYTLHVQKKNTVEWYINGVKKGEQTALAGVELAGIPDATLASNGAIFGKVFKGWATAEIEGEVAAGAAGIVETPTVMPAADTKYYAVYALETPGEATNYNLGSATLKGTASGGNSASSGYALTTNKTTDKDGFTQDSGTKNSTIIHLQVKSSSDTQIITSEPSAITVTATLGGGSTKDPLDYPVNVVLVDNSGNSVGDTIILTTKITNTTGSEFTASMPLTNYANVRGFKVFHMKEDGWNVRYYTIALSYTTSAAPTYSKYATSGPKELDVPTFTVAAGTYEEAQHIGLEAADGDIYYTLDGTEPTTESTKYTAAIVLDAFGEYTIKAFAAKEDGSRSEVVSATYSMKIPFETVAAMIEYMVDNSVANETNVTVTGIISQVDQFTSNKITYWISDNGQTNAFEVYLGLGIGGATFEAITDLNVGDKVTVKGNYTLYKETTHEFSANSQLISHTVAEVASIEVAGTAETTEYFYNESVVFDGLTATAIYNTGYEKDVTANAEWSADPAKVAASGDVTVTATYAGKSGNKVVAVTKKLRAAELAWSAAEAKAYTAGKEYELPSLTNEHGLAIVYSSSVPAVATISEAGVVAPLTAGTTVITASFEGNAEYAAQEVTYTLSVVAPTSLVIIGDAQAAYEYNETFNFEGLGAKAIYPDEAEYEIPSGDLSAWTATPNRITENGKVKVTVDWATRTSEIREFDVTVLTHDVTFDIPANGTLVVKYNDNPIKSGDHFVKGDELTVVATPASELYELTALTANGVNIMEGKSFAIGTEDVEVVATFTLKPFASLEALVAADLDMSVDQEVTVSFSNVEITNFAYGEAFLNVKDKNEKNISIYAGVDVPEEWIVGGKVSGTAIVGLWIYDDDAKYYWLSMYNEWTGISYTKPEAPISWPNNEAVAYTVGKENTWQTLNNEKTLTVSYSSTTPAVATINAETGAITPLTEGTTTIKATYTEDLYLGKEVSYTLNVYAPKSLAISGECQTVYEAGDAFNRTGLIATATYGDESEFVVTDLAEWTVDPATVSANGNIAVSAAWQGLNAAKEIAVEVKAHKITFAAPENGTLVVKNAGVAIKSGDEFVKGTVLTVEATPANGYVLSALTAGETNIKDSKSFTVTADVEVAATFAHPYIALIGQMNGWAGGVNPLVENGETASATVTLTMNENYGYGFKILVGDLGLSAKGSGEWYRIHRGWTTAKLDWVDANSDPMWLSMDMAGDYTFTWNYTDSTLTITYPELPEMEYYVAGNFTDWSTNKVKMTTTDDETWTATFELEANKTGDQKYEFKIVEKQLGENWLGLNSAASMVYGNCTDWVIGGGEAAIGLETTKAAKYTFTYVPADKTVSINIPSPEDIPSAIDEVNADEQARKYMLNGQFFIERGGKIYDAQGQLVK